jgi:3D (Asp-Asp-Asp) domain-containing protein
VSIFSTPGRCQAGFAAALRRDPYQTDRRPQPTSQLTAMPLGRVLSCVAICGQLPQRGFNRLQSLLIAVLVALAALSLNLVQVAHAEGPAQANGLQIGQSAVVTGTEGRGMRVRVGPGMAHRIVTTANEGTTVQVIAGPVSDGDDDWYQISVGTATTGWGVGRYLIPSTSVRAMSNVEGRRTFIAKVTAYADGIGGVPIGARTYSGTKTRWGVVAVDPKIIPIGSTLEIDGYDGVTFVAEDIGGGIKGESLDIWLPDAKEAKTYGTQYRRITIIREGPAK